MRKEELAQIEEINRKHVNKQTKEEIKSSKVHLLSFGVLGLHLTELTRVIAECVWIWLV